MQFSRPARRANLVVHVAASVGWFGLTLGLLALGITAAVTESPAAAEAAYRSMKVFGDWLIIPISLATLVSGLVLSLGTPWGLARHRWIYAKFWLTLVTAVASALALRPGINSAAAEASAEAATGHAITVAPNLVAAPSVALSAYLFMTVISVLKPWGMTKRGRRARTDRVSARMTAGSADSVGSAGSVRSAAGRS
ncbi:DUF2269 family protein [Streptomyces sp. H27-D2]|uniref:DUF2269 family protein n=1 Tax=Streptomyces sp. H27-D2 TaxID=3046304 RepID=UPI002DB6A6C9|nr:DUF2269 family protein [Streptomyces sp. H27-D2]MEC4015774.1 DUF2269 family protein [Streptomyces sp. H27-D2]